MSVFAWRRRATRHFGEQWIPFAEIYLRAASGRWHAFSVQVDSGAVISVVSRSAAELLGIELEAGESIQLAGISAPPQRYFVHRFAAKVGELPEFGLRVAVADREDVPNLLGRLDVLERFQIDLDISLEETRMSLPWLDAGDRRVWRACLGAAEKIRQGWAGHSLPGRADEAARRFINRADQLTAAGVGLLKLHREFELPLTPALHNSAASGGGAEGLEQGGESLACPGVGVEGEGEDALGAGKAAGAAKKCATKGTKLFESPEGGAVWGGVSTRRSGAHL